MSVVEIRDLVKQFSDRPVVNKLSLSVSRGEILALLGSSGCGKTTTLRCIAGLESPTSGEIWIDGVQVAGGGKPTPAERRNIGMVFQSYAIWPHMTVAANVAYGLRLKKLPKARIKEAVAEALSLVMLDGLGDRYPSQLSGGQQQRVALARSIVTQPAVLLLDEPLSNLDAKMREQMRGELREVIKRTGITAIHITHDQAEAMAVADRIGVMHEGTITQIGSAREIYRQPNCRFVAGFVGRANFIPARVTAVGKGQLSLTTDGGLEVVAVPVDWPRSEIMSCSQCGPRIIELLPSVNRLRPIAGPQRCRGPSSSGRWSNILYRSCRTNSRSAAQLTFLMIKWPISASHPITSWSCRCRC